MAVSPLDNPAKPDGPKQPTAVVLTKPRVIKHQQWTYTVPAGQVIGILSLPAITTFNPGADAKLIPAGNLKVGDIAPS
jgi:hypothetical protein